MDKESWFEISLYIVGALVLIGIIFLISFSCGWSW